MARNIAHLSLLLLGACGGKIDGAGTPGPASASTGSSDDRQAPWSSSSSVGPVDSAGDSGIGTYASDGLWGVWQLASVPGPNGINYAPPFFELALRPDSTAYSWSCLADPNDSATAVTGNGIVCPATRRVGCVAGTVVLSGTTWHVTLTSTDDLRVLGEGDVLEDPSGDIRIDGTGVLPKGARYHRVAAPNAASCFP